MMKPANVKVVGFCLCALATSWSVAFAAEAVKSQSAGGVISQDKRTAMQQELEALQARLKVLKGELDRAPDSAELNASATAGNPRTGATPALPSPQQWSSVREDPDIATTSGRSTTDRSEARGADVEKPEGVRLASLTPSKRGDFRVRAVSRDDADSADHRRLEEDSRPVEPVLEGPSALLPDERALGHYPTKREWETIGGYYPRFIGDNPGGGESDRNTQAPSGLWRYPSAQDGYFNRHHPRFFDAVDRYLGLFAPDGVIAYEGPNFSTGGLFSFSGNVPFLTRSFNPQRGMLKLGPVYLDLLSLSGTILYSDYHGPEHFAPGDEDGWLAVTTLDFRVVVPLAENLFLAATGGVYYLPFENRVGIYSGDGGGLGLGLNFFAAWEKEINGWWLTFTDRLGTHDRFGDYHEEWSVDEIDVAGRYRFGRLDSGGTRHLDFFSSKRLFLANTADFSVIGLLNPNWRLTSNVVRTDGWDFANDDSFFLDDYRGNTRASTRIDYAGQDWRFAPFARYSISVDDRFQSFLHQAEIGVRGPITQQLRLDARAGYAWTNGDSPFTHSFTWELGLSHEFGPYTHQSLYVGNVVSETDFAERRIGNFARYTVEQTLSKHARAALYGQWQDTEDVDSGDRAEGYGGGVRLSLSVTDYTRIHLSATYDRYNVEGSPDYEDYLYGATLEHRILAGLYASFRYRYERYNSLGGSGDFNEHLYQLTLTQVF